MREYIEEDLGEGRVLRIYADGTKHWYKNGKYHREDGPALEYANGDKEYWLFDENYDSLPSPEKIKIIRKEQMIEGVIL